MKKLFFLLIFPLAGYSQDTTKSYSGVDSLLKVLDSIQKTSKSSYEFDNPKNWEINPNPGMGLELVIISPLESLQDKFRENINLFIAQRANLDKYYVDSKEQCKKMLTDFKIISDRKVESKKNSITSCYLLAFRESSN